MATLSKHLTVPESIVSPAGIVMILGQGLILRLLFMRDVAVNGDTGLYLYDALQIVWGRQMFVQFPGRSPTVEVPLAVVVWLFPDARLEAARIFMIFISLAVGLAVYLLAAEIYSPRIGIVAMSIQVLTPFPLVWGMWVKTEQFAALFTLLAFYIAVREFDRDRPRFAMAAAIGVLFGVGALARRSIIVTVGAFCLFVVWYFWRHRDDFRRVVPLGLAAAGAGLVTTFLPIFALAYFDLGLAFTIYDMYFLGLVESNGFGVHGYLPLLSDQYIPHQYSADALGDTPWYWAFCGKCGPPTFLTMAMTAAAALPAVVLLLPWLKARTELSPLRLAADMVPALLVVYALFAAVTARGGVISGGLPFLVFSVGVILIWLLPTPSWDVLWRPKVNVVFLTLIALTAGYLYRDRILYPTYFQEFYPFIAILAAVALVYTWDGIRPDLRPSIQWRWIRRASAVFLLLTVVVGAQWSYPFVGDDGDQTDWYTMERVEDFGADIDRRLDPGERVFAANPLFVIESDHRLARHLSRKYYLFEGWPEHGATNAEGRAIAATLNRSDVPVAIRTSELEEVLDAHETVNRTFNREFCAIDDPLYEQMENTTTYVRTDDVDMPPCGSQITRTRDGEAIVGVGI